MVEIKTQVSFNNDLQMLVASANRRAMYKAATLAMRMARQKIRYRSYRMSSRPGQSPFKHSTGARSFSHSIRFYVDSTGSTALIGPQREAKKANLSGPVPHTLEFGGRTRRGPNTMWFQRKNVPWGIDSESKVAAFFKKQGWGPLFMNTSAGALRSQTGDRPLGVKRAPARGAGTRANYRLVYYLPTRITSDRQAARAAKNVVKYFGYPTVAASTIAPRPFMGPTLKENYSKIMTFWQNMI